MKTLTILCAAALLAACSNGAPAASGKALSCSASETGAVAAEGAWVREQANADGMSAAYFSLCNGTMAPVTLTGVETPLAGAASLHETTRDADGVVSMNEAGEIILAPGERVVFAPGGKHAMLMSLKGPIRAGDASTLVLDFADGSKLSVDAVARSAVEAAGDPMADHSEH